MLQCMWYAKLVWMPLCACPARLLFSFVLRMILNMIGAVNFSVWSIYRLNASQLMPQQGPNSPLLGPSISAQVHLYRVFWWTQHMSFSKFCHEEAMNVQCSEPQQFILLGKVQYFTAEFIDILLKVFYVCSEPPACQSPL